jgi:hypothetical protein
MAEMMFYQKPVPLDRQRHQALRYRPSSDFGFTRVVNSVPLNAPEFFEASRDMPALFRRDGAGNFFPVGLMALRNDGHDLVDQEGRWLGSYVPAFIRRYPFALGRDRTLCFDSAAPGFGEQEGEPLFDAEGKQTAFLESVVRFLQQDELDAMRTREFCLALTAQGLIRPLEARIKAGNGAPVRLDGFYAIDEKRFHALPGDVVDAWFRKGWIAWAYAHLFSLGSLGALAKRNARK